MNPQEFKDVHEFDGKLNIVLERNFKKNEKITLFNSLIDIFRSKNPISFLMLTKIRDDLINENNNNYDDTNNCDASDVLANIITSKNIDLFYDLFEEQLIDIYQLGACPQGRVGRLYQIYLICK